MVVDVVLYWTREYTVCNGNSETDVPSGAAGACLPDAEAQTRAIKRRSCEIPRTQCAEAEVAVAVARCINNYLFFAYDAWIYG